MLQLGANAAKGGRFSVSPVRGLTSVTFSVKLASYTTSPSVWLKRARRLDTGFGTGNGSSRGWMEVVSMPNSSHLAWVQRPLERTSPE